AQTHKYAIVMNAQNLPEVKWGQDYRKLAQKSNERQFTHTTNFYIKKNVTLSFNNIDEVVAEKKDVVVFGTATYLPPYGKVSGFDADKLKKRGDALGWIKTIKPGLVGYSYEGVTCQNNYNNASRGCPELIYKTQFTFGNSGLAKKANGGGLDIYVDKSRENSPIYKLQDYPGLGVSFNLSSESLVKSVKYNKIISSFSEDVTQQNGTQSHHKDKNLVYTTGDYQYKNRYSSRYVGQDEHSAVAFYLNAKLHLLDKKNIKNIAQGKTVNLGTLKPYVEPTEEWKNKRGSHFQGNWTFEDKGEVSVKLKLPEVKAGRCINANNPNPNAKAPSPA
ncbi:TPA: PilC family type IV pilus tip adhesin, partial [Neisseria meningitidis]